MNLCALCLHRTSDERFNEDNWNTETVKIGRFLKIVNNPTHVLDEIPTCNLKEKSWALIIVESC